MEGVRRSDRAVLGPLVISSPMGCVEVDPRRGNSAGYNARIAPRRRPPRTPARKTIGHQDLRTKDSFGDLFELQDVVESGELPLRNVRSSATPHPQSVQKKAASWR